jgi:hypothetical protein
MNKELRKKFITLKAYFGKGVGEFSGIKSIFSLFILISIWLEQRGMGTNMWMVIGGFILIVAGFTVAGWLWDKAHLYDEEQEFSNKRNNFVKEVREKL